ncbi:MAG TPA: ABC transporter permease [Gemmataceae bacterium]|nr:ABC transporter permease [Gemmataceae bacterium]
MSWIAWKMLTGDRSKYLGIIFGVAFASLLMAHQVSIFVGIMRRTTSQISDIHEANIWVMDPKVQYVEEAAPLHDTDLTRVRGVPGVEWAVRLYKGLVRARMPDGNFRQVVLLGLDDASLVGAPVTMIKGHLADLRKPDAVVLDEAGFQYMWPGEPFSLDKTIEMNDRRAIVVGICKAGAPFQTMPIMYTRYNQAVLFAPRERKLLTFVLARSKPGVPVEEVCARIEEQTGLKALTKEGFTWETIKYYLRFTGIPVNFGITVALGFIVGVAIAGQTFYLFTIENLRQFGALKAMGVSNLRIVGMVLLQAAVVGVIGYGIGMGLAAVFFEVTKGSVALAGFYLPWQVMVMTGAAVLLIVVLASFVSIRRVLVLEPAVVFRG